MLVKENMLSILRYNKNCIEDSKELTRIENIGFVNFMYSKFDMFNTKGVAP